MSVSANYFDGVTSKAWPVTVSIGEHHDVQIDGYTKPLQYPLSDLQISPRVGSTPRNVQLPGGAALQIPDNEFVDTLLMQAPAARVTHWPHILEQRWRYAAIALIGTIALVWWTTAVGIPMLAKFVADSVPAETDTRLGEDSLAVLDRVMFQETALSSQQTDQLTRAFYQLVAASGDSHHYRLVFRKGGTIGANAFALPSGIIIVTDELVKLAQEEGEILAVLAHEVGHVVNRHGLRTALQDSVSSLVIAAVAGDIASIASLSATIPTILVHTKYSRQFEAEADDYALRYLLSNHLDPRLFVTILQRLDKSHRQGEGSNTPNFLSSHPATEDRMIQFNKAAESLNDKAI